MAYDRSILDRPFVHGKGITCVLGSFETNASLDPDSADNVNPPGWTVAYTSTGTYTVTFEDDYSAYIGCQPSLSMATPDGSYATAGPFTAAAGSTDATLEIEDRSAADALLDLAADPDNRVTFLAWFKRESLAR